MRQHGQYLQWTKNRAIAECWWCLYQTQTREHLFKDCPRWKRQQKTHWAKVGKETEWGKVRLKVRDLLADDWCTRAVLDFPNSTDVGLRVVLDRVEAGGHRARAQEEEAGEE
jgi:hypothetical protein